MRCMQVSARSECPLDLTDRRSRFVEIVGTALMITAIFSPRGPSKFTALSSAEVRKPSELGVVGLAGGGEQQSVTKCLDHCIGCAFDGRCVTGNEKKHAACCLGKQRWKGQFQLHDEVEVHH